MSDASRNNDLLKRYRAAKGKEREKLYKEFVELQRARREEADRSRPRRIERAVQPQQAAPTLPPSPPSPKRFAPVNFSNDALVLGTRVIYVRREPYVAQGRPAGTFAGYVQESNSKQMELRLDGAQYSTMLAPDEFKFVTSIGTGNRAFANSRGNRALVSNRSEQAFASSRGKHVMIPARVAPHVRSTAVESALGAGKTALSWRLYFTYEADLAGGAEHEFASERAPVLHIFATQGLGVIDADGDDDGVVVVDTSTLAAQHEIVVDVPFNPAGAQHARLDADRLWALPGARSRDALVPPDARGRSPVPADATISFNAYAETATQHGQACRTRAGEALFLLSDLLETTPSPADRVRVAWQKTGDVPLAKGFVSVRYAELVHHTANGAFVVKPDDHFFFDSDADTAIFHEYDVLPGARERAAATSEELANAVNSSLAVFFPSESAPLGTSVPSSLRRMHCPYFNTSAGLLWGSTYALRVPRSPPPPHFYEAALAATLARNDAHPDHVMAAVRAQADAPTRTLASSRFVSKLFVEMLTVFANAMVYLDDFTNEGGRTYLATIDSNASPDASKRGHVQAVRLVRRSEEKIEGIESRNVVNVVEDYKTARLGHGDDCEGVAKEIYVQYWDFLRAELDAGNSELLHHLQSLARAHVYVPALMLAAVTNKKLDTAVQPLSDEEAMAHTYTAFIKTSTFLASLSDADKSTPLAAKVRSSSYARAYRAAEWHAGLDDVLVAEGTARSSAFVRPTTTYYAADDVDRIRRLATARYAAQMALLEAKLPMNAVSIEIPNRRVDDEGGAIARDKADVSDFYKANSAMYVSAFRDTGVLDFATAQTSSSTASGLTHGMRFTRFSQPRWDASSRLVPYNPLSERSGALADAVLSQLEPIPPLRRDDAVAQKREAEGAPTALLAVEHLFEQPAAATGAATAVLLEHPERMPDVPHSIVLTVRAEDASDEVSRGIVEAVSAARSHFSGARVRTHYLSAAPVRGDETSLPPVILYDVELRLA
jgi:hypothetical protein